MMDTFCMMKSHQKKRLGKIFENETKYRSNSVGKSLVSYVLGHAICEGYIKSLDVVINDWPLIEKTLYHNQKLINLVNMAAGDQEHVHNRNGLVKTGRWYNNESIKSFANRELKKFNAFKNSWATAIPLQWITN